VNKSPHTSIYGMPYFPGSARGVLCRGVDGITTNSIALLSSSEIQSITALPAGFIIVEGAPFSHTAITLFGYGVPSVIISEQQALELTEGTSLFLDGSTGQITSNIEIKGGQAHELPQLRARQTVLTASGESVKLCASVRSVEAAQYAAKIGAESIGLVRSEFLLPDDDRVPDQEFYRSTFHELCEGAGPLSVTIRLLDIAADKMPGWMPASDMPAGALGMQGVRLYGIEPVRSVIEAQLSAINAIANQFNIRLLIPYLVRYEELKFWRDWVCERLSQTLEIGAMAETPSSVLDIHNWFDHADFIAIGCNDLMQCLFAADRDKSELRRYLDPYAPILFRIFKQVADSAGGNLGRVQLCGVLPQLQGVLPVLLGLGYRVFSVDAQFIPYLEKTVNSIKLADAERLATDVCDATESQEVLEILRLPIDRHLSFQVG
jgi:phosphoenolpyruvate-protein kinase (PTS system EI component)